MGGLYKGGKRGATALTYGLVVGLVGIGALGAVTNVGDSVLSLFGTVSDDMLLVPQNDIKVTIEGIPDAMDVTDQSRVSEPVTVTLTNGGRNTSPTLTVSLTNTDDFEIVSDGCNGKTIEREKSCAVSIRATRDINGSYTGQLTIQGAGVQLALAGTGSNINLYDFTSHTFSNCGQTGRYGPALATCRSSYNTDWDGNNDYYTMPTQGYQVWTVPRTGTYRITAAGARGGNGYNGSSYRGNGRIIRADVQLTEGEKLTFVVGQAGQDRNGSIYHGGGGGGGTFIGKGSGNGASVFMVAGGGGGANAYGNYGYSGRYRGNGDGETFSNGDISENWGNYRGNGASVSNYGLDQYNNASYRANPFTVDARGGLNSSCYSTFGGFGGGGTPHCHNGGGGGGRHGGAGGYGTTHAGAGGGSWINGITGVSNTSTNQGTNAGHGYAEVEYLNP